MPNNMDFADDQWKLLAELPIRVAIGAAVIETRSEGVGASDREMLAAMKELAGAETKFPHNSLIQTILHELKEEKHEAGGAREIEIPAGEAWTALIDSILEQCRQASQLLSDKNMTENAGEYKTWLLDIATKAIMATTSGGFLGIGGEQITKQEQVFINELKTALGLVSS